MNPDDIKVVGTIDLTPSWKSATIISLMVLRNTESEDAKKLSENELIKMAQGYDELIKRHADLMEQLQSRFPSPEEIERNGLK